MIVSASRRCDIPAFAGDWFMGALRAGQVEVAHPFHSRPGRRVSLRREDVDAFVFWSRDPRPFLRHLPKIDRLGYPYYFLITATGYPRQLEPCTPRIDDALDFFKELAGRIGRNRIIWRYDPVIFTGQTPFAFHVNNFSELARILSPCTFRVIVSFFDPYPKVLRRLRKAMIDVETATGTPEQQTDLLQSFATSAVASGLEIQSCAEAASGAGVRPGKCVDEGLLHELFGLNLACKKDPGQRKLCLCQQSVDIGSYGSCRHGCLYCYAR
jgi:hypothetical protein